MKLRYVSLLGLLLSQRGYAQISTDTCCAPRVPSVLPVRATARGFFRLTNRLGVVLPYRADATDQGGFQEAGALGTFAADYYFRRRFGLGAEVGYLSYGVRQAYAQYFNDAQALDNLPPAATEQTAVSNSYSFHVLAGPVLSLLVFRRLTLTTTLRGGLFLTDAPTGNAYSPGSQQLLYRLSTSEQRLQPGGAASLAVHYPLSPVVELGLGAAVFAQPVTYAVDNLRGTTYHFDRMLGGYSAFASLVYSVHPRPARGEQLPVVLPTCYAPVLATESLPVYNAALAEAAVLNWKSGAPIYAGDEEFTVRLYALPTNRLLLERTTTGLQLNVPPLKLPEATAQLYYTVQSGRRDQSGQRCLSPVVTGSVLVVRK